MGNKTCTLTKKAHFQLYNYQLIFIEKINWVTFIQNWLTTSDEQDNGFRFSHNHEGYLYSQNTANII